MNSSQITRRDFLKGSAYAIALISFPSLAIGQNASRTRLEWQQFKTTAQYSKFYDLIRRMRANTDSSSPASWNFWTNVHANYCPHNAPYFLAWHRGYLYSFEQALQNLLNDPSFALPYWDYYTNPTIPSEFTDPTPGNPLYMRRSGTDVSNALTLAPFDPSVVNFPRRAPNAFEPLLETRPHNAIHNLIGGQMGGLTSSPTDPIFYVHHANIDRLWDAWVRSGGRRGPITANPYNASNSDPYWADSFTYAPNLTLPRYLTYNPAWLGYGYATNTVPKAAKASHGSPFKLAKGSTISGGIKLMQASSETPPGIKLVQAPALPFGIKLPPLPARPPLGDFLASAARQISATRQSLGGVTGVALGDASVTARLPVAASALQTLQNAISAALAPTAPAGTPRSVIVVLDTVQLVGNGANGGHFYNIYLNLPSSGGSAGDELKYLLGTVGPFEISVASHHGAAVLEYPANDVLSKLSPSELQELTVSFQRVNGDNAPQGQVMSIGEVRIDASTDPAYEGNR
jgi:tyrosinase